MGFLMNLKKNMSSENMVLDGFQVKVATLKRTNEFKTCLHSFLFVISEGHPVSFDSIFFIHED